MAQIYIRGQQNPIEVSQNQANQIKALINKGKTSEMISVGSLMVKINEIKMVKDDFVVHEAKPMFDVNDPSVRQMLRDFEKELATYGYPAFDRWCVDKGYYTHPIYHEYIRPDGTKYSKPEDYMVRADVHVAWEMKRALETLQAKTNFAKKMELENLGNARQTLIEKMDAGEVSLSGVSFEDEIISTPK